MERIFCDLFARNEGQSSKIDINLRFSRARGNPLCCDDVLCSPSQVQSLSQNLADVIYPRQAAAAFQACYQGQIVEANAPDKEGQLIHRNRVLDKARIDILL